MQTLSISPAIRRLTVVALTLLVLPALAVRAGDEKKEDPPKKVWQLLKPDRLVADSTFFYVSTPDLRKAHLAYERTALRALLSEDEVVSPILSTLSKLKETYVKGDGTRSEAEVRRRNDELELFLKLVPYLDGQVALAVEAEMGEGDRLPRFLLIASMPSGDAGEERQRVLEDLFDRFRYSQTTDPRFKDFDDRVGTYDVHRIENTELKLNEGWAFVENLFVYGQGKRVVEDAIDRFSLKNGAGTLALHTGYQSAYREVARGERGDAVLYTHLDIGALLNRLADSTPGLKAILDMNKAFSDTSRPQLALGIQVPDGDKAAIREKIVVRTPKEMLPKYDSSKPWQVVTSRMASSDTLFYSARRDSIANMVKMQLDQFKAMMKNATGQEFTLDQQLKGAQIVENEQDLISKLELFKGELAFFMNYVSQPSARFENLADVFQTFQFVVALEVDHDNAELALKDLLLRMQRASGHTYNQTTYANSTIYYQKGAAPREEKESNAPLGLFANLLTPAVDGRNVPFFLAYSVVDLEMAAGEQPRKFLVLSDNLNALKKALIQATQPRTSLAEEKKFKDPLRQFRDSHFAVGYFDLNRLVDVYTSLLPSLGKSGLVQRETLNQLPSPTALRANLFPMSWAQTAVSDPDGVLLEYSSPVGNLPMIGLVASVAWPAINESHKRAISTEIDSKFKRINLGLQLYAADFDRYPQQLSDLYPTYVRELSVFESPFKRGSVKNPADIDNAEFTNLLYSADRSLQDLAREIVLHEKEATKLIRSGEGSKLFHHVLTVDGRSTALPRTTLDRRLTGKVEFVTTNVGDGSETEKPEQPKKK